MALATEMLWDGVGKAVIGVAMCVEGEGGRRLMAIPATIVALGMASFALVFTPFTLVVDWWMER